MAPRPRRRIYSETRLVRAESAYPLITLAFATGLRCGELLALRYGPGSLDLSGGRITIGPKGNLGRKRGPDGIFPLIRPKSRASERMVDVPPSAVHVLREHRLATGRPPDGAFVFADERDNPISGATVAYRDWRRAVADASIPDPRPRFHDARHHWAMMMLRAGVQEQEIADQGGWRSLTMLLDRYGCHALPDEHVGSGARLDAYLAFHRSG